jgi:hypothetical protein
VADKPIWVERIMSDTASYQSFLDFVRSNETSLLEEMRKCVSHNDMDQARVFGGESRAWEKLRNQLLMYEREEQQNGIIQEQARPTR